MTEKATSTTKKPAARKTSTASKVSIPKEAKTERKPVVVKKRTFKPDDYVTVRNGFDGRLVYKSSKTGEKFVFERFGDEHDMEIQELKKARNDAKKFFANNWFLIDDPEVIEYLGLSEYYKNAFSYDEFDQLADMTADEIAERMTKVSEGQKIAIAHHARRMIAEGKIDSMRAITALEKGLGVQLIEH
jgi:hypothetical protein